MPSQLVSHHWTCLCNLRSPCKNKLNFVVTMGVNAQNWLWYMVSFACLTYLMMQLKASSPNLMVHQQNALSNYSYVQGIYHKIANNLPPCTQDLWDLYSPKWWTTKTKKLFGSGCFKGWRKGKTFWQPWNAWNEWIFSHCSSPPKFNQPKA